MFLPMTKRNPAEEWRLSKRDKSDFGDLEEKLGL